MKRFIAVLSCFFLLFAASAQAQTSDEAFCAMAPVEMLAALDGDWKLKPGPGVVMAGIVGGKAATLPLPAQKAQKLSFTYDANNASVTIVDSKTGDDFIMVPTTPEAADVVLGIMKDWTSEDFLAVGKGCDWYSIPLMIASNTYSLNHNAPGLKTPDGDTVYGITGAFGGWKFEYCPTGMKDDPDNIFTIVPDKTEQFIPGEVNVVTENFDKFICKYNPIPLQGDLVMNLILKFQTPSSATGVLHFEGEMNGSKAVAVRPVTLSR